MAMAPGNPPIHDRPDVATETRLVRVEVGVENLVMAVRELRADVRDIRGEMKDIRGETNELRKQAREDFRILFAAIVATNLGLGSLMAKGFGWF